MKKRIQILSIAITIVLVSCGRYNAEISTTFTTGGKELSTNTSVACNEADLLLIDMDGQLRFNPEPGHEAEMCECRSVASARSYIIDRREVTKLLLD